MTITNATQEKIIELINNMMIDKLKKYHPETKYSPFITSLVRDKKRVNSYSFIHSLQTSLGMSAYEQISKIIAESKGHLCITQWKSPPMVDRKRLEKIDQILTEIGNKTRLPNRAQEEKEILSIPNVDEIEKTNKKDGQTVDVYIKTNKNEFYFDIKTVKPNKSGFLNHKRLILTWIARANKHITSAIVFPYNPYYPKKYSRVGFDQFSKDDVFIGEDYWNLLGGKGCYSQILNAFDIAGNESWEKVQAKLDSL
mgnify:CR=1 FL=1|jgi:hypothetical protein